ncbi:MAG: YqeG family HAD IIIA-type phosphatase [Vulcanimicrobiota bacterium]
MKDPLKPDEYVTRVASIDFQALAERGIRYFCFDVDNTLVPQHGHEIVPCAKAAIAAARKAGYIEDICLISNVMFRGRRIQRLEKIAAELSIEKVFPALLFTRKPGPTPFRWALEKLGSQPEHTCMVGDQIFSDILGGNRFGFHTILVTSLGQDHWSTRLTGRRSRERRLIARYGLKPRE